MDEDSDVSGEDGVRAWSEESEVSGEDGVLPWNESSERTREDGVLRKMGRRWMATRGLPMKTNCGWMR